MSEIRQYAVTGMSCGHCEAAVTEEVSALDAVTDLSVSSSQGTLSITVEESSTLEDAQVIAAVDEAGYTAQRV